MQHKSFKNRLQFFIILLVLNIIIVGFVFLQYNLQFKKANKQSAQLKELNLIVKSIAIKEKDFLLYAKYDTTFFKTGYNIHLKERKVYIEKYNLLLDKLQPNNSIIEYNDILKRLTETITEKNLLFDKLVTLFNNNGLEKLGLYGKIETISNKVAHYPELYNNTLYRNTKDYEKRYLISKNLSYVSEFNKSIADLEYQTEKSNSPHKNTILDILKDYKNTFLLIVTNNIAIGNFENEGLLSEIFWLTGTIDSYVNQLNNRIEDNLSQMQQKMYVVLVVIMLFSAFIVFIFIGFVYRYLANPIVTLSKAIQNIADNNFTDTRFEVSHNRNDEIGQLYSVTRIMLNRLGEYLTKIKQQKDDVISMNSNLRIQSEELMAQSELLHKINKKLKKSNKTIKQLYHEQSSLIHIVAHDLKSPLANIHQGLQLIKSNISFDSQSERIFEMLFDVLGGGFNLIQDLLDAHALEFKNENLLFENIEIVSFVEKVVFAYQQNARAKDIEVHFLADYPQTTINTVPKHLIRIIDNLLSNAIKFSPLNRNIYINIRTGENVKISIQDEGPGFTEDDKKNAFKKFQKLSATPTGNESSSGLGLSIVKTLVKQLHGDIQLISEAGNGSTFTITLPKNLKFEQDEKNINS